MVRRAAFCFCCLWCSLISILCFSSSISTLSISSGVKGTKSTLRRSCMFESIRITFKIISAQYILAFERLNKPIVISYMPSAMGKSLVLSLFVKYRMRITICQSKLAAPVTRPRSTYRNKIVLYWLLQCPFRSKRTSIRSLQGAHKWSRNRLGIETYPLLLLQWRWYSGKQWSCVHRATRRKWKSW